MHGEVFSHILEQLPDIRKFKVLQKKQDVLQVQIESPRPLPVDCKDRIITQIQRELGDAMTVNVEEVDTIPTDKSGKFRWVVSELEYPGGEGTT